MLCFLKGSQGIKCQCSDFYFSSSVCWLVLIVTLAQSRIIRKESRSEEISSSICPCACKRRGGLS